MGTEIKVGTTGRSPYCLFSHLLNHATEYQSVGMVPSTVAIAKMTNLPSKKALIATREGSKAI